MENLRVTTNHEIALAMEGDFLHIKTVSVGPDGYQEELYSTTTVSLMQEIEGVAHYNLCHCHADGNTITLRMGMRPEPAGTLGTPAFGGAGGGIADLRDILRIAKEQEVGQLIDVHLFLLPNGGILNGYLTNQTL